MSEPSYPTRVSDPDETARIPKDALDALRDADQAKDGNPGSPAGSAPAGRSLDDRNGSGPAQRSGPNSGATPAIGPDSRPSGFRPANGSGAGSAGIPSPGVPSAGAPSTRAPGGSGPGGFGPGAGGPGGPGGGSAGANGSITGYRRSDYAPPTAYPSSYGSAGFSTLTDAPTTVTGPGGPGAGNAAAARTALGAATRSPGGRPAPNAARPARRARLLVRHIDPWSTLKFSFVLAVAMFFVWLVAIGVLYGVLDGMGVFEQINGLYDEVSGNGGDSLFSPGLVLGTAALVGVVNIVLFTALATIGSFVYNICSDLVGGIEITLAEKD
jgi:hypothetical protein